MDKVATMPVTTMQDEQLPPATEETLPPVKADPQWSAALVFVTSWVLPATSARRMAHVSLPKAFLVHLGTAMILWLLIDAMAAWESDRHAIGDLTIEAFAEFVQDPEEALAVTGIVIFCVEGGYLALAGLVGCWGAADEKIRSSFRHSLRCVWLLSPHVLPIAMIVFFVAVQISIAQREWYRSLQDRPYPVPSNYATTQAYNDAAMLYRQQWRTMWDHSPWHVRYADELLGYLGFVMGTWALWALLRAVGSRRNPPRVERPPMCEFCGYNLSVAPMEGRCPECGNPVVESLGPQARPGPGWEHRGRLGVLATWWHCTVDPIVRPRWFGRQIQVCSRRHDHRLFLLTHMALMGIIGYVGVMLIYAAVEGSPFADTRMAEELRWIVAPMSGYSTAIFGLVLAILAAGLVGLWFRLHGKRNLISAAMRNACYLGGFVTLWAVFAAVIGAGVAGLANDGFYQICEDSLHIDDDLLVFLSVAAPNLVILLAYFYLLLKGTAAARYANQ